MGRDSRARILVVEDEADIADSVVDGLREHGYEAVWAADGATARRLFSESWDLILLDLMLPDLSGESLLNYLAERPDYPSVIIVSAKSALADKLTLFRQGCDDYLTKPYLFEELLARIESLLRRPPRVRAQTLTLDDLELQQETNTLRTSGGSVVLTPKETALLKLLLQSQGRIVSRKEILTSIWGLTQEPDANYVGIHLFKLRKKLAELDRDGWLKTVKFAGYSFSPANAGTP